MAQIHHYEVNVEWTEGRKGILSSMALNTTIECATPPEFPNGVPGIWSPEHLYVAAINSCYMATFLAIAESFKLPFNAFSCKTVCKVEVVENRYQITEAIVSPILTLANPEADKDKGIKVLEKSKSACLVTNSMQTEIILNINVM